jgi:hypothetical protein
MFIHLKLVTLYYCIALLSKHVLATVTSDQLTSIIGKHHEKGFKVQKHQHHSKKKVNHGNSYPEIEQTSSDSSSGTSSSGSSSSTESDLNPEALEFVPSNFNPSTASSTTDSMGMNNGAVSTDEAALPHLTHGDKNNLMHILDSHSKQSSNADDPRNWKRTDRRFDQFDPNVMNSDAPWHKNMELGKNRIDPIADDAEIQQGFDQGGAYLYQDNQFLKDADLKKGYDLGGKFLEQQHTDDQNGKPRKTISPVTLEKNGDTTTMVNLPPVYPLTPTESESNGRNGDTTMVNPPPGYPKIPPKSALRSLNNEY